MHRIELGERKKWRNAREWRSVPVAQCGALRVEGDGEIIARLCQQMLEAGMSGDVAVWRGGIPVFHGKKIEEWASGKALRGEQPEHLARAK